MDAQGFKYYVTFLRMNQRTKYKIFTEFYEGKHSNKGTNSPVRI